MNPSSDRPLDQAAGQTPANPTALERCAQVNRERIVELLVDRAIEGLTSEEDAELRTLIADDSWLRSESGGYSAFDLAAAAADLAMVGATVREMPESVRERLAQTADLFLASQRPRALTPAAPTLTLRGSNDESVALPRSQSSGSRTVVFPRGAGWLVAAASLTLAAVGWWPRMSGPARTPSEIETITSTLQGAGDVVNVSWTPWAVEKSPPEFPTVTGEVVWSDAKQTGLMKFHGLPAGGGANSPDYQLWIIDGTRGMEQRISGAIFRADVATGEVVVPIHAALHVNKAAAFAITVEQPGGTWVSDMKRRVVIAPVKAPD